MRNLDWPSFQSPILVVLCAFRQMVALDHLPNFRVVFEYLHRWNLELRFLPSFHFLKVHKNSLPCGVVIDDEDGASFPLDSGEYLMRLHLMIRR